MYTYIIIYIYMCIYMHIYLRHQFISQRPSPYFRLAAPTKSNWMEIIQPNRWLNDPWNYPQLAHWSWSVSLVFFSWRPKLKACNELVNFGYASFLGSLSTIHWLNPHVWLFKPNFGWISPPTGSKRILFRLANLDSVFLLRSQSLPGAMVKPQVFILMYPLAI